MYVPLSIYATMNVHGEKIFSIQHGMGIPSLAILLHEVFKLLAYAKCKGVVMLRLGTCGGIGMNIFRS